VAVHRHQQRHPHGFLTAGLTIFGGVTPQLRQIWRGRLGEAQRLTARTIPRRICLALQRYFVQNYLNDRHRKGLRRVQVAVVAGE
jgi:hypothetical protein